MAAGAAGMYYRGMDYTGIPAGLLRLADALSRLVPAWLKQERDQADRLADYCERMALVLDDTVGHLRRGHRPHGNCAEIDRYMHKSLDLLRSHVGEDELSQIGDDLSFAYKVEYLDLAFDDVATRERGYQAAESAAGRFRALAATLRASGYSGRD